MWKIGRGRNENPLIRPDAVVAGLSNSLLSIQALIERRISGAPATNMFPNSAMLTAVF